MFKETMEKDWWSRLHLLNIVEDKHGHWKQRTIGYRCFRPFIRLGRSEVWWYWHGESGGAEIPGKHPVYLVDRWFESDRALKEIEG